MDIAAGPTTPYDGCGKCLVAVRRLSRKNEASNSPEKQLYQIVEATTAVGAHIIGWADDWEVSGATDPTKRPQFGPWLRDEKGPYDGIAGAAVDRIGRNVRDVLNTAYTIHGNGQILVTADHFGIWDLDDPAQESELLLKALGAQLEHRAIKKRTTDDASRARLSGRPRQGPSYGYRFVRKTPGGRVDHVELDPLASKVIREVAERILSDETGMITLASECKRLTREGILTPRDHRAVMYGREPKGASWSWRSLREILTNEAALGYLMHKDKPVLGEDGHPKKIAPQLWNVATRDALVRKLEAKPNAPKVKAPRTTSLISGVAFCGNCGRLMNQTAMKDYACVGRVRGIRGSENCKPAPNMKRKDANAVVSKWFLSEYGNAEVMRKQFDPGTGHANRIKEIEKDLERLRGDRSAGLYDSPQDSIWYREEYSRMGREIAELKELPERPPGMRLMPTGKSVADEWISASDDAKRREILAEFGVRVEIYPASVPERVRCTGMNPY